MMNKRQARQQTSRAVQPLNQKTKRHNSACESVETIRPKIDKTKQFGQKKNPSFDA